MRFRPSTTHLIWPLPDSLRENLRLLPISSLLASTTLKSINGEGCIIRSPQEGTEKMQAVQVVVVQAGGGMVAGAEIFGLIPSAGYYSKATTSPFRATSISAGGNISGFVPTRYG